MSPRSILANEIKEEARRLGFDAVGIALAAAFDQRDRRIIVVLCIVHFSRPLIFMVFSIEPIMPPPQIHHGAKEPAGDPTGSFSLRRFLPHDCKLLVHPRAVPMANALSDAEVLKEGCTLFIGKPLLLINKLHDL